MDLINRKLGKYELTERLGHGGMAEVYKAFQPGVERFVAIKVMLSHLADSEDFIQRFQREARSIGQLQHTNIARVIDFDAESNLYYMVMDYIQGGTLADYLKTEGALPPQRALEIVSQLADGLGYAHQQKMIHRDIKPDNVMFADQEKNMPVITDFGIARLMDDNAGLTVAGAMVGTPSYMSPEAARGDTCDERTDLYSLGVVLYEMVTGSTPYTADTPYGVIMKQANEPLPPPTELKPDLPESVNTLLLKALDKEPNQRYQSAAEFSNDIRATLSELGGTTNTSSRTRPNTSSTNTSRTRANKPGKSKLPLLLAGAGVLLVALFTFFILTMLDGETEPSQPIADTDTTVESAVSATSTTVSPTSTTAADDQGVADLATANDGSENSSENSSGNDGENNSEAEDAISPSSAPPSLHELGTFTFTDNEQSNAGDFHLTLNQIPDPPEDSHYELWLTSAGETALNLGRLTVEQGRIDFQGSTEQNLLANYDQAEIRLINDQEANDDEGQVLLVSQPPPEWLATLRPLLSSTQERESGLLAHATEQLQLALQHTGFIQNALDKNDLAGVQKHAEHVVNILDGDAGAHKDDLDGDGHSQNPGDGVGLHNYLQTVHNELATALMPSNTDDAPIPAPILSLQRCVDLTDEAIEQGIKVFASDTAGEAQPFVNNTRQLLENVLIGESEDSTGLLQAQTVLQNLAAFRFVENNAVEADAEMTMEQLLAHYQTSPNQKRRGRIRFVDHFYELGEEESQVDYGNFGLQQDDADNASNDSGYGSGDYGGSGYGNDGYGSDGYGGGDYGGGDYGGSSSGYDYGSSSTSQKSKDDVAPIKMGRARAAKLWIELDNLAVPDSGYHYALWLAGDAGSLVRLGELIAENGRVSMELATEENLLAQYSTVQVSLQADDTDEISDQIIFTATHPAEILTPLRQLLAQNDLDIEQGLIAGAETEVSVAMDHNRFVIAALQQNKLPEALRHAEHVINTLEGKDGVHYGDMDKDGMAQNPGDGVGVQAYLATAESQLTALDDMIGDGDVRFYYERARSAHANSSRWLEEAMELAIKLFAMDTPEEALPVMEELVTVLDALQNGADLNGNGIIEPTQHEGGVGALYDYSLLLAEFVIE